MNTTRTLTTQLNDTIHRTLTNTQLLPTALTNIRHALPGYPTSGGTGNGPQLNDDGTPPGLDRHLTDPVTKDQNELTKLIQRMNADSIRLNLILTNWTNHTDTANNTNGTDCEACGTHITKPERLRAGLCNACRMHWQRWTQNNNGDRHDWMWERRRNTAIKQ